MLKVEYLSPGELRPYSGNAKLHPAEQVEQIKNSITEFGFNDPVAIWGENEVVEGHGRLIAALELGLESIPVIRLDDLTEEQRRAYALVHNKLTMNSGFDFDLLQMELDDINDIDMSEFGFDFSGSKEFDESLATGVSLAERFVVPPFTILDTRQGYWKERKTAWKGKIGDAGQARGVKPDTFDSHYSNMNLTDASILDPVLSEIICKWYGLEGGKCFDVFAGDTAFGFVSSYLGNEFTGIELRQEQADFNTARTQGMHARYICDDGRNVLKHIEENSQDLFFSCPPYYDLEVYSDSPNDASNQETYEEFYAILDTAFRSAVKCLKENRFAVVVCGDIRNKKSGEYYGFPDDIKRTFRECGLLLYNELILVDPIGTARLRAKKMMAT